MLTEINIIKKEINVNFLDGYGEAYSSIPQVFSVFSEKGVVSF